MLEKGLDPELVKPMIKEFLQQDPDYIAAMEYKKDKEAKESISKSLLPSPIAITSSLLI